MHEAIESFSRAASSLKHITVCDLEEEGAGMLAIIFQQLSELRDSEGTVSLCPFLTLLIRYNRIQEKTQMEKTPIGENPNIFVHLEKTPKSFARNRRKPQYLKILYLFIFF